MKESKIKLIIIVVSIFITLLTGIIVAVKTKVGYGDLDELGVIILKNGTINSNFFTRFLSMLLIALICFGCSFNKFLFPIALIFLSYRGYLLGLNIVLIIVSSGLIGIVSLIIIIPCQIMALAALAVFYILMTKTQSDFKCFGGCRVPNQRMKIIVYSLIIFLVLCILQSILLAIFSPKVVLVL